MARNKYPEETERLILETAQELFSRKGYDNTSIQDIINNLGGLSKGAIYHHFKSKEDILLSLLDRMDKSITDEMLRVRDARDLNGYQKLQMLFRQSVYNSDKQVAFKTAPDLMKNPRMLVLHIQAIYNEVVPQYIVPILEEGIRDGSIQTDYPKELAEVMMLLSNFWLNPLVYHNEKHMESLMNRVKLYRQIFSKLGFELIDDEMEKKFLELGEDYYNRDGRNSEQ